jgi:beta-galactosidase
VLQRLRGQQSPPRIAAAALVGLLAVSALGYGGVRLLNAGSGDARNDAADRCSTDPDACIITAPPLPSGGPSGTPTGSPGAPPGGDPSASPRTGTPSPTQDPYDDHTPRRQRPLVASDRFVSDLDFTRADNGLGPVERDRSNGTEKARDGDTLSIDGHEFSRGLGVHADSDVQVVLGGSCSRFTARIGVDDEAERDDDGDGTEVVFTVLADAKVVYRSEVLERGDSPVEVDVDISGAERLDLVVDDLGFSFGDQADWADARVRCLG